MTWTRKQIKESHTTCQKYKCFWQSHAKQNNNNNNKQLNKNKLKWKKKKKITKKSPTWYTIKDISNRFSTWKPIKEASIFFPLNLITFNLSSWKFPKSCSLILHSFFIEKDRPIGYVDMVTRWRRPSSWMWRHYRRSLPSFGPQRPI